MAREQLKNLTEPLYYTLLALTSPRHGYEIMQTVEVTTKGRVRIGAGTLYTLLSRFEKEKIICRVSDDGRRKTYSLTEKGRELLENEFNRLQLLVEDGNSFLRGDLHG